MSEVKNITPPATLSEECSRLKDAYVACQQTGDTQAALRVYMTLHEIEDGY
mgnify:CR=1 FL=1